MAGEWKWIGQGDPELSHKRKIEIIDPKSCNAKKRGARRYSAHPDLGENAAEKGKKRPEKEEKRALTKKL